MYDEYVTGDYACIDDNHTDIDVDNWVDEQSRDLRQRDNFYITGNDGDNVKSVTGVENDESSSRQWQVMKRQ